jgi:LSD1 subclass zinc finger protein
MPAASAAPEVREAPAASAGLCSTCRHARLLRSARGSTFVRCALSDHDERWPRFPTLPVMRCRGFEAEGAHAVGRDSVEPHEP